MEAESVKMFEGGQEVSVLGENCSMSLCHCRELCLTWTHLGL